MTTVLLLFEPLWPDYRRIREVVCSYYSREKNVILQRKS